MRTRHVNLLVALVAVLLFSFSCFCISRMTHTGNQLTNCRNQISEFKETILRLKNKTEINRQELIKAFNQMKYKLAEREDASLNSVKKKVNALNKNETVSNAFEVLRFFFPHLRKVDRIYPDVIIGKEKTGVSFALGISTVNRGNHSYLKQTLTSIISRMTLSEEKDSVVIVSIADLANQTSIRFLFFDAVCPTQSYVLLTEDDILANKMYLTKITDFIHNITSNNWFYIEFSVLGFIGKLFKSEDLTDFVHFFLMFYKDKPIDLLLGDIFQLKMCNPGETLEKCTERNKHIRIRYKPSLFQHVGIQSSFPGREQYFKEI
ncbi:alpha-1,3-mannosyl-glycoprotein 4-beta-N-acetylglucosaminyltransferase-like protein MGAT4D isoform X3 [Balaenoptera acutorostrata]|uniref:Alpha-1,3-mannosyl-glycoprotein 4-beta-N-acetylglucosaminyltransferase-like protein MGAT4D isoform X3 n=1 Tax=Balaenoptera acutorostrata TaxID=9767 RepID=A0ABM3TJT9_BALAC|nr:alpha-1,3-mannosyl-glycoprotein 4-beta-N-acetylglucosaminyltransferase-like protein MGAT4D isoform X3 [Balaenoptera acutorostrata]